MITSAISAWAILFVPSFVSSSAYEFVFLDPNVATTVGVGYLAVALLTGLALKYEYTLSLIAAFSVYGFFQTWFGASILSLTLAGSVGAITGAYQWWLGAALTGFCLWRQARS